MDHSSSFFTQDLCRLMGIAIAPAVQSMASLAWQQQLRSQHLREQNRALKVRRIIIPVPKCATHICMVHPVRYFHKSLPSPRNIQALIARCKQQKAHEAAFAQTPSQKDPSAPPIGDLLKWPSSPDRIPHTIHTPRTPGRVFQTSELPEPPPFTMVGTGEDQDAAPMVQVLSTAHDQEANVRPAAASMAMDPQQQWAIESSGGDRGPPQDLI
jgi:hypothetical protein